MAQIDDLLKAMAARGASDLHLTTGFKPYIRLHGDMTQLDEFAVLTPDANRALLMEIAPEENQHEFELKLDTDFAYALPGTGRFRVNVFMDRYGIGSVARLIPSKIPTLEDLGMPAVLRDFCGLTKGLVLVTGATGSGKSTTLAAMIDYINRTRAAHIITIEDPVEFVYEPKKCLINQRELKTHTKSFPNALRAALREDPDIVLVGEMRDLETIEIAIETAETGHLVFGTLHTNTAPSTVDRIIDKFPSDRQNQIRSMLASSLKGVVAQVLCRRQPKGRIAAVEVLVGTNAISSNIREGKTHMIPSAMQTGRGIGMRQFNDSLMELVTAGHITPREAHSKSLERDVLLKKFRDTGIPFDPATADEGAAPPPPPPPPAPAAPPPPPQPERPNIEQTMRQLADTVRRDPSDLNALNTLAWHFATQADDRLRSATNAVQLAERAHALTQGTSASVLLTLAAAYAEAGRHDESLATARRGLEVATAANDTGSAAAIRQCLPHFEQRTPLRLAG